MFFVPMQRGAGHVRRGGGVRERQRVHREAGVRAARGGAGSGHHPQRGHSGGRGVQAPWRHR